MGCTARSARGHTRHLDPSHLCSCFKPPLGKNTPCPRPFPVLVLDTQASQGSLALSPSWSVSPVRRKGPKDPGITDFSLWTLFLNKVTIRPIVFLNRVVKFPWSVRGLAVLDSAALDCPRCSILHAAGAEDSASGLGLF